MKRITILFAFFLSTNLYCQEYEPLLSNNKFWDVVYWESGGIIPQTSGERQFLKGDTLIQDKTYCIIRAKSIIPINEPNVFYPPFSISEGSYIVGFIREDTINKKVYTCGENDSIEYLTYDFDLQPKDTLILAYLDSVTAIVDSVVTIKLNNGLDADKYYFKHNSYLKEGNDFYIEGIGGASSLMYPFDYDFEFGANLDGVLIEDEKVYCNGCYIVTSVSENEFEQSLISFYPNPVNNEIIVHNKMGNYGILKLTSIDGRLVYSINLESSQETIRINLSGCNKGLYILSFKTNKATVTKLILKK